MELLMRGQRGQMTTEVVRADGTNQECEENESNGVKKRRRQTGNKKKKNMWTEGRRTGGLHVLTVASPGAIRRLRSEVEVMDLKEVWGSGTALPLFLSYNKSYDRGTHTLTSSRDTAAHTHASRGRHVCMCVADSSEAAGCRKTLPALKRKNERHRRADASLASLLSAPPPYCEGQAELGNIQCWLK
ncbi:hypothetical protein GOODEAATRI_029492 [Goodea atripinnis]|uniref:Uncharacterized protein n=1 Tax=Goodea atripinnis TaxID=208336 RepID=A0ABV0NFM7_9TELE